MGATMSTVVGWVVVIAVAGIFIHRGRTTHRRVTPKVQRQKDERNQLQARRETKEREKETKVRRRVAEASEKEKPKAPQQESQQSKPSYSQAVAGYSSDDDLNNREFAKQLSSAKQGTKFSSKSKDDVRHKSVKQSHAEETPFRAATDDHKLSAPSSTAGIDADDDQSSAAPSPVVSAVHASGDVSDMLEKPAAGPSVLRLTDTEGTKQKTKAPKAPVEAAETKKQRQRRKQAEAAKAAGAEAEADRRTKMEAQRRLARESEGRAAMDGSGFMAAQAKGNVWTGANRSSVIGGPNGTNGFLPVQPLDTFEPKASKPTSAAAPPATAQSDDWMSSLPSEEEQMEILMRDDQAWSTVKPKSRKPKKKGSPSDSTDEGDVPASAPRNPEKKTEPAVNAAPAAAQENKRPAKAFNQKSSFAALSTEASADQEEEEEEWDV